MNETLRGNRDFVRLFAAQVTSLVGSGATSVALAAFAYQLTGRNATTVVGLALMLRILAFLLFSQPAGVLADRIRRKRMLVSADLLRVGLLGLFPFITAVWQIHALIFAINAVTAFFTPTFEASIPEVVGSRLYTRALSLSRVAVDLEAALGPLLAGVLIAWVGVRWTFWFDGVTYLVSAGLVLTSRVPSPSGTGAAFRWHDLFAQIPHGTRVLLREPALRRALVLHVAEATAGAAVIVTTIVYARDVLHRGDVVFAVAMAAVGVGSSLTALFLARRVEVSTAATEPRTRHLGYHRWAERTLVFGGAVLAVALLPGALRPGLALVLLLWAINGAGQAMIAIPSVGLLAEHTEPEERGRAYAAHFAWTHLFWLGTYPAVGFLARAVGTPLTFTIAGAACALLTTAAALMGSAHRSHALVTEG